MEEKVFKTMKFNSKKTTKILLFFTVIAIVAFIVLAITSYIPDFSSRYDKFATHTCNEKCDYKYIHCPFDYGTSASEYAFNMTTDNLPLLCVPLGLFLLGLFVEFVPRLFDSKWSLTDKGIVVGGVKYSFCEIEEVENIEPEKGCRGTFKIKVVAKGLLGTDTQLLAYNYEERENAKLAEKFINQKIKEVSENSELSTEKNKKGNVGCIFMLIIIVQTAIIGFNLSYGTSIYRAIMLFAGGFVGLVFSLIISALIDRIPQKIGTIFKPLLMVIIVGALCVGIVFTYGIGGTKKASSGSHKEHSSVCKLCKDKQATKGDYCLECYISLKQIADAFEE